MITHKVSGNSSLTMVAVMLTAAGVSGLAGCDKGPDRTRLSTRGAHLLAEPVALRCPAQGCTVNITVTDPVSPATQCDVVVDMPVVYVDHGNPVITWTIDAASAGRGYRLDDVVAGKRAIHFPSNHEHDKTLPDAEQPKDKQFIEPAAETADTSFSWKAKKVKFKLFTYEISVKHMSNGVKCVLDPVIINKS